MSILRVQKIRHTGSNTDVIDIANDGTCTANITNNLSNRNLIINGAMQVAQRGTSFTATGSYPVDRFRPQWGGADENPTVAQVDVASGTTPYTLGFRKAIKITNGDQSSGAGTGDYLFLRYKVEAQDLAESGWNYTSASSYITLSFWVKSSVSQTFQCRLETQDGTKQNYPFETGSLTADTWTKITKTIPGNSNITVNNDNGCGVEIWWELFRGTDETDNSLTNEAWTAETATNRTKDQTPTWWTTDNATYEITGVQLEVSDYATDFEHRSFAQELELCSRYYRRYTNTQNGNTYFSQGNVDNNGNDCQMMIFFDRPFRTQISSLETSGSAGDYAVRRDSTKTLDAVPVMYSATDYSCYLGFKSNSHGWSTGQAVLGVFKNTNAFLGFSAEL